MKKRIFISYSHKDEKWKDVLVTHLKGLQTQENFDVWHDRRIKAGEDWHPAIEEVIDNSTIAILLVTANFLASDFIRTEEVPLILKSRVEGKMHIVPLIVSPCAWKKIFWLQKIQVRPKDGEPLSAYTEHEINTILSELVLEIIRMLKQEAKEEPMAEIYAIWNKPGKISLSKLPTTGSVLLGREKELDILDKAWKDDNISILTLVAWGGVGKTALVNEWLNQMAKDNFRSAQRVYA